MIVLVIMLLVVTGLLLFVLRQYNMLWDSINRLSIEIKELKKELSKWLYYYLLLYYLLIRA